VIGVSPARCALASLLACAPIALRWLAPEALPASAVSACGWVALTWIALAGLPLNAIPARSSSLTALAALLPCLALAAAVDRRADVAPISIAATCAGALVLSAAGAWAAASACERGAGAAHVAVWCLIAFAGPAAELVASLGSTGGRAPEWIAVWSSASPLRWAASRIAEPPPGLVRADALALIGAALLAAAPRIGRARGAP
jgi:hypothetical protein